MISTNSKQIKDLPLHSRVWIYQADRNLREDEISTIESKGSEFLSSWAAHGTDLEAAIEVKYNLFVIIAVDEMVEAASGCSIDKSVHFMQGLGNSLGVDFFNRMLVAYRENDSIKQKPMIKVEELLKEGVLNENTVVFNNLVANKGEFETKWEIGLKDSWHKQLLQH